MYPIVMLPALAAVLGMSTVPLAAPLPPAHTAAATADATDACSVEAVCTSAAKVAAEIYPKYIETSRRIGCKVVMLASGGVVPEADCRSSSEKMEQLARDMIRFWNDMVSNSWATIGPRRWDINSASSAVSHSGTVQSVGTRMFVQEAPITSSRARISVRKVDGNGKVTVTVCASGAKGEPQVLWTFTMDANDADGKLWTRDLGGVQGKVLSIHLVGKTPLRKLQYRVRGTAL